MRSLIFISIFFSINASAVQQQQISIQGIKSDLYECAFSERQDELYSGPGQVQRHQDRCTRETQKAYSVGLKTEDIVDIIKAGILDANKEKVSRGGQFNFTEAYEEAKRQMSIEIARQQQQQMQQQQPGN